MPIEHIRLSQQARDQLIKLKRSTKLAHWNVLCRWAFCVSLAETTIPTPAKIPADSAVEMTWKVFGGQYHEAYWAVLKERCVRDGLATDDETLNDQFRLHLHRGLAYLAADRRLRSITDLVRRAIPATAE